MLDTLDTISELWIDYGNSSISKALKAQDEVGTSFEIGLGWKQQRDTFRGQFSGTEEDFKAHLNSDKILHSAVAELYASEAMQSISHRFIDAITNFYNNINEEEEIDTALFQFVGPPEPGSDFGKSFLNRAVSWIQSHGRNTLHEPKLSSIEKIRVRFWDDFKDEHDNRDACHGSAHVLGRQPWNCPTCVLDVVLTKHGIQRPLQGRLKKIRNSDASSGSSDGFAPVATAQNNVPVQSNVVPAQLTALTTSATQPVATTSSATQALVAPRFKPTYLQIRANGSNQLVATQLSLAIVDILSRSRNLPEAQKDSRLTTVGGVRYLCPYGPQNNKCPCYFQCRPDLAKHGRDDHGVVFPAADWIEIGPYNVDEMRLLRPGYSFVLRSTKDPAHMR